MSQSPMVGPELDRVLSEIYSAESAANNEKVVYIKDGRLAFEDGKALFDIVEQ